AEHLLELVGLRARHGLERRFIALLVPDLVVIAALTAGAHRQDDEVEHQPPLDAVFLDDAAVGEKLLQVAAHRPVIGGVGRAEIDQQHADAAARHWGCGRAHDLPSFGSAPGATSLTAPLSLVTDCSVAATVASSAASGAAHSAISVMLSCSP